MGEYAETIRFWRGRLPHWEVVGGRYFVTVRLAGCLPECALRKLRELAERPPVAVAGKAYVEWSRRYFRLQEHLLHGAGGHSWLRRPEVAECVLNIAKGYDEDGTWRLSACSVMPNHIHVFFQVGSGGTLKQVMESFKHFAARSANKILNRRGKRFWQREWFDHWSRSGIEDGKIRRYIRDNAVQAKLVRNWQEWPWAWERDL